MQLAPLEVSEEWVERIRGSIGELPRQRRARYVEQYDLPEYDAEVLLRDREVSDYFEDVVRAGVDAKLASNWIMGVVMRVMNERGIGIGDFPIPPASLADLIAAVAGGKISNKVAREQVFPEMLQGKPAAQVIEERGLVQISDESALAAAVDEVLAENAKAVEDFRSGKKTAVSFLVGQTMKKTRGKANPAAVSKLILSRLSS